VGYFLLLARAPFPERGPENAWKGDVRFTIPDVTAERKDVPPEFAAVLRKACAWDPDDRYPTGAALREAIEAAGFVTGERRVPEAGLLERIRRLF
jgi:hypothetical protein